MIYLQGVSILFENSRFENLTEYGDGCIVFQDSTVAFTNTVFAGNTQATAGAIFGNNTVLSIDNSVFVDNYGFQSGAIQMLGDNSMLYVNGTTFHNNTGGCCFATSRSSKHGPAPDAACITCPIHSVPLSWTPQSLHPCIRAGPLHVQLPTHIGWQEPIRPLSLCGCFNHRPQPPLSIQIPMLMLAYHCHILLAASCTTTCALESSLHVFAVRPIPDAML